MKLAGHGAAVGADNVMVRLPDPADPARMRWHATPLTLALGVLASLLATRNPVHKPV